MITQKTAHLGRITALSAALTALIAGVFAVSLAGCGSSEADKSAPPINRQQAENRPGLNTTQTGQFVDSAVSGLFYQTETHEGFTDHNGYFQFEPNETVTFSIGNITLGSALAASIVTPLDIAGSDNINDTATNILRLLQTLDYDGDPSNGISITTNTHVAASQLADNAVSVKVPADVFESNLALNELIGQVTNVSGLVDANQALAHFKQTQQQLNLADR